MGRTAETRVPCSRKTRARLKACKRGGESYDSVLRKMVQQYDPEDAVEVPRGGETTNTHG